MLSTVSPMVDQVSVWWSLHASWHQTKDRTQGKNLNHTLNHVRSQFWQYIFFHYFFFFFFFWLYWILFIVFCSIHIISTESKFSLELTIKINFFPFFHVHCHDSHCIYFLPPILHHPHVEIVLVNMVGMSLVHIWSVKK